MEQLPSRRRRKFRIQRTDEEWAASLTKDEFSVMRLAKRGRSWRGEFLDKFPVTGMFACKACGQPLYNPANKFDDGAGYCAFDQCFYQNLYCSGLELRTGTRVWLAACTGCGSHIARVTRGEMRTTRNERHSVHSLSLRYMDAGATIGARKPPEGPLVIDGANVPLVGASSDQAIGANQNASTTPEMRCSAPPVIKTASMERNGDAALKSSKSKSYANDDKLRPCKHLLSTLESLKRYQSISRNASDKGHKTEHQVSDAPGSVNLPCSHADLSETSGSGRTQFYFGCKKCEIRHTPMHRCIRTNNWVCLYPGCNAAYCKRYMRDHYRQAREHSIVLTSGLSIWCLTCKRHVFDRRCERLLRQAHLDRFRARPMATTPSAETSNGSAVLRQSLGYQNAQCCACSLCNPQRAPECTLPGVVEVPDYPDPPHPSYIHMKGARGSAPNHRTQEILDRIKGMIVGAALGDALGQITTGLGHEVARAVFGKLVASKRLNFEHAQLRPTPRRLKARGHRLGEWTAATDLMILGIQSLVAFGGRLECPDAAFRLYRYANVGLAVSQFKRGVENGKFTRKGVLSVFLRRVIGDDITHYALNSHTAALEAFRAYSLSNKAAACSNESVLRTFIYGTCNFEAPETAIRNTRNSCRITHSSPRAIGASIAVSSSISMMLNDKYSWSSGNDQRCQFMQRDAFFVVCQDEAMNDFQSEFRGALIDGNVGPVGGEVWARIEQIAPPCDGEDSDWSSDNSEIYEGPQDENNNATARKDISSISRLNLGHYSSGSDALKLAALAFWAQRYSKAEYMEAIMEVLLQGADASANGCVVGAIMGLRVGYAKLPTHWLAHLRGHEWLANLADQYTKLFWG